MEERPASATAASAAPPGEVRELRLALVCYGGVSLAIYMHGVTKEIHKLVQASAAFERDQRQHPFDPNDTAGVYWELLRGRSELQGRETSDAPRTRVVVDIISGASAGGINGVFLAKALAGNLSQDALRDLWFDKGDIKNLIRGWKWVPTWLRGAAWVIGSLRGPFRVEPPLRGDEMCRWLRDALVAMDATGPAPDGLSSLVSADHRLSLHVPVTDFHGHPIEISLDDPRIVRDRSHRHVMEFVHDANDRGFAPESNDALAFAARATSSFPGAFPPITLADYRQGAGTTTPDGYWDRYFPSQRLADVDPEDSYFIDGGVLDNFPFATSIQAIQTRRAWTEVDRRLIFIEPDPATEAAGTERGTRPGWYATIFGGFAGIARKEPIADDLLRLGRRNATVRAIRDVIEAGFEGMRDRVAALVGGHERLSAPVLSASDIGGQRIHAEEVAAERAGFAYTTYLRLRISDVVEDYARLIRRMQVFPADSVHGRFVATVLRTWARQEGLFDQEPDPTKEQRSFLAGFDVSYHERRIRFMLAALSWWYGDLGTPGNPTRAELDASKARLYALVRQLGSIVRTLDHDPDIRSIVSTLFSKQTIEDERSVRRLKEFIAEHQGELVALRDRVASLTAEVVAEVERGLDAEIVAASGPWSPGAHTDFLVRYLGFPFWDILVYPVAALAGLDERDEVEVMRISPMERRSLLRKDGTRDPLVGVGLGHFGAFFSRKGREHDYLWGRLDAAERLIALLMDDPSEPGLSPPDPEATRQAFEAILASEEPTLTTATELVTTLRERIQKR